MKTTTFEVSNERTPAFQRKKIITFKRVEPTNARPIIAEKSELAHRDLGLLLLVVIVLGLLWRYFGAWIGRESIRLQTEPGKFVTRAEEYQDLHNQVGLNSFFRMY